MKLSLIALHIFLNLIISRISCNKNWEDIFQIFLLIDINVFIFYYLLSYYVYLYFSMFLQATQLSTCPKKLDLSKTGLSRIPDSTIAFPAIEELALGCNQFTNIDNNLKLLHRYTFYILKYKNLFGSPIHFPLFPLLLISPIITRWKKSQAVIKYPPILMRLMRKRADKKGKKRN